MNFLCVYIVVSLVAVCQGVPTNRSSIAIETECQPPVQVLSEYTVEQQWLGGGIVRFNFTPEFSLARNWTVLIRLKEQLPEGAMMESWIAVVEFEVDEDRRDVIFKGSLDEPPTETLFPFFITLEGFNPKSDADLTTLIDLAVIFDAHDEVCMEFNATVDNNLMSKSQVDEVEPMKGDECKYMPNAVTMSSHLWKNEDGKWNFQGKIFIEEPLNDWTLKLIFDAPVDKMEAWVGAPEQDEDNFGYLWFVRPMDYNTHTGKLKFEFIATTAQNYAPSGIVYLCNDGAEPSSALSIPQEVENEFELFQSLAETIATEDIEEEEEFKFRSAEDEREKINQLIRLFVK